jgi:Cu-Zn family superoxide dismutase
VEDLWGRSVIVHADPDDLGKGPFEDSPTTGHSGARIACAVFGRV